MNYFIGFAHFGQDLDGLDASPTGWLLPPSEAPPAVAGDEVFLVGSGRGEDSCCLAWHFIIGRLRPHLAAIEVVPSRSFLLPDLALPKHVASELPRPDKTMVGRLLVPVDPDIGRLLHQISQDHLRSQPSSVSIGRSRTPRKKEKSPEQQIKDFEKRAKGRLGQTDFREALVEAYGGRCAVSKCSIDACLTAAHILDYSVDQCQEAWNGILLRADIHLLFDRHLLRIFPGNPPIVVLGACIRESGEYGRFHLQPLQVPRGFDDVRTNRELRRRWDAANRVLAHFPDPPKAGEGGKT